MKIIIVGAGATGLALANIFAEREEVTIIEENPDLAEDIANKTSAMVVEGDGTDRSILKEAGIEEADVVIPLADDDKTNIMISVISRAEGAEKIIPLVNSPENEELFPKIGVDLFVSGVEAKVSAIEELIYRDVRAISQLGRGEVQIVEIDVNEESKFCGKEAGEEERVRIIYRDGDLILPEEDTIIQKGDILVLAVKTEDLPSLIESIDQK